jgi:hypothetical protein
MRNTAGVTGGKPIAVFLQSISGVSAINSLVAFYGIHGGKSEVLFFYNMHNIVEKHFNTRAKPGRLTSKCKSIVNVNFFMR